VWFKLLIIGISAYFIGNGAMFWSLKFLPTTTFSLLMNFQPLIILFFGAVWLKEEPSFGQIVGVSFHWWGVPCSSCPSGNLVPA
jgi:drug/metabolite transporter (DMT)-like permease